MSHETDKRLIKSAWVSAQNEILLCQGNRGNH